MNAGPQIPPTNNTLKMPSIVDPSTNQIIKRGRVKTPNDLVSAYTSLWWADLDSAQQRTLAQQWRDGASPFSLRKERLMGMAGRTNVNWGLGDQIALDAEMPYNDLLEGVDTLFTMPTNYGDENNRYYYEQVMAEEVTRMLRNWSRFDPLYQQNVRLFVDEGVSFCMFEDDFGWQWDVVGLQHLVFPRRVKADVNAIDIICAFRQLLPHKLYERCADEAAAANEGWDREATWEAIKTAAQPTLQANDFQEWEKAWKNHDYILGQTAITVPVIHGWVREVDGTVTHLICRADGQGKFLYKKEGKFDDMSHLIVPFSYGVGANGDFHSVHGVLQKTFAAGTAMNSVFCRFIDMAIHSSTPYMQADSEEALQEQPLTPMGQYVSMSPGYGWVETKLPDFAQSLQPVMQQLTGFLSARSAPYTSTVPGASTERRTKYEQQSQDERDAKLSSGGVTLFKNSLTGLYKEVVRRIIREEYPQSWVGGAEVQEFRARCMARGVPLKAILDVDVKRLEVNMGIGRGSAAARRVSADSLNTLYTRADAKGQQIINYQIASAYATPSLAREIFPPQAGLRPPQDLEDANNENSSITSAAALGLPQNIMVLPTQNHSVHIESHLGGLDRLNQQLQAQQMNLQMAIQCMTPLFAHAVQHFQMLDPQNPNAPVYKNQLNQFNEVIVNGNRQIASEQMRMQREAEHNGPQSMGPEDENAMAQAAHLDAQAGHVHAQTQQANTATLIQAIQASEELKNAQQARALAQAKFEREEARKDGIAAAQIAKAGLGKSTIPR